MEKLKKLLDRLLFPGAAVVVLSVPVAAALQRGAAFSGGKAVGDAKPLCQALPQGHPL